MTVVRFEELPRPTVTGSPRNSQDLSPDGLSTWSLAGHFVNLPLLYPPAD